MSGGELNFAYQKVQWAADDINRLATGRPDQDQLHAFAGTVQLFAELLRSIEYDFSQDSALTPEDYRAMDMYTKTAKAIRIPSLPPAAGPGAERPEKDPTPLPLAPDLDLEGVIEAVKKGTTPNALIGTRLNARRVVNDLAARLRSSPPGAPARPPVVLDPTNMVEDSCLVSWADCTACGGDVEERSKFCRTCGSPVEWRAEPPKGEGKAP